MSTRVALTGNPPSAAAPPSEKPNHRKEVPNVISKEILNYLDSRSQAAAAQVCRQWRLIAKDPQLDLGRALVFRRAVRCRPAQVLIQEPSFKSSFIYFEGANERIALFSQTMRLATVMVLDRKSGTMTDVDLRRFFTLEDTLRAGTGQKVIAVAAPLWRRRFVTVLKGGAVAIWRIVGREIEMLRSLNIFSQTRPGLNQAWHVNARIKHGHVSAHRLFFQVFGASGFINLRELNRTEAISFVRTPEYLAARNATQGFYLGLGYLGCKSAQSPIEEPDLWEFDFPPGPGGWLLPIMPIEVNDRAVVVNQYFASSQPVYNSETQTSISYILDARSGEELFCVPFDYHLPLKFINLINHYKLSWLRGNYFVLWAVNKLQVWDINARKCFTLINLEQILTREELMETSSFYMPILNVEVEKDELQIFYSKLKPVPAIPEARFGDVQIARFDLKNPADPIERPAEPEVLPQPRLSQPPPAPIPAAPPSASLLSRLSQAVSNFVSAIWEAIKSLFARVFRL